VTLRDWLAARRPAPPRLADQIASLLSAHLDEHAEPVVLLRTAAEAIARINRDARHERADALELLAADAIATYAFELAAEGEDSLAPLATRGMMELADSAQSA
jgi:uncharacterized membrane protein